MLDAGSGPIDCPTKSPAETAAMRRGDMDQNTPRLPPLADSDLSSRQEALLGDTLTGRRENAARVMVRHPERYAPFITFSGNILLNSTLAELDREWVVVRTCHLCRGAYPIKQHLKLLKHYGASEDDIALILSGPDSPGLSEFQDATWHVLRGHFSDEQLIDYALLIGWYVTISSTYNTLRVPFNQRP